MAIENKSDWLKANFPNGIKSISITHKTNPGFIFSGGDDHMFASLIWWFMNESTRPVHSVKIMSNPDPAVEAWKKAVAYGETYESFETWYENTKSARPHF